MYQYCAINGGGNVQLTVEALNAAQQNGNWRVQCFVTEEGGGGWFLLERQIDVGHELAKAGTWVEFPPGDFLSASAAALSRLPNTRLGQPRVIGFFNEGTPGVQVLSRYESRGEQPGQNIVIGIGLLKDAVRDITAVPVFTWQQRQFAGQCVGDRVYLVELGPANGSERLPVRAIVAAGTEDFKTIPADLLEAWKRAEGHLRTAPVS